MKKIALLILSFCLSVLNNNSLAQLFDNYDGAGGLGYSSEDASFWVVNSGQYEGQTGSSSSPNHSYSSYDMTGSLAGWDLSNSNTNEWIGWMDLNRPSVSGWGNSSYSCGMVLAADNSDFNSNTTVGYAIGLKNTSDLLVLFKFSAGITGGTTELPGTSTEILSSGYTYSDADNGVNFYVKLESDGKWTIKYKAGAQLSDADAVDAAKYSDGSVTSSTADETYRGTDYKHSGWIYAHNSGGSEKVYFDNFGFAQNGSMPVELTSFSAIIINSSIKLNWRTETEVNNYGFEVERQVGSRQSTVGNWKPIGFVDGHGNSNSPKEYEYIDENIVSGKYAYRLKQIDNDGSFELSKVIEVDMDAPIAYELSQNYPNPFNPVTTIKFTIAKSGFVKLSYYNILGELKGTIVNEFKEAGIHTVSFNASDLNSGIYFFKLEADNFVQIKKMSLIK